MSKDEVVFLGILDVNQLQAKALVGSHHAASWVEVMQPALVDILVSYSLAGC